MIEAVGKEFLPTFFKNVQVFIKIQGVMLLQPLPLSDQRLGKVTVKNVDFFQKLFFPPHGGYLPSQLLI